MKTPAEILFTNYHKARAANRKALAAVIQSRTKAEVDATTAIAAATLAACTEARKAYRGAL